MGSELVITLFESQLAMARKLADRIEVQLRGAIVERGAASFAASGGATPAALYDELSQRELDWSKVTVVLVDERWVAPGEEGSNESFVCSSLCANKAACAKLVGLWSDVPTPQDGLAEAEQRLRVIDRPIDVVVLGMGNDGHTASWFPNVDELDVVLVSASRVAAVTATKGALISEHLERITLTLGTVSNARSIYLLIAGAEKRSVFQSALAGDNVNDMPVRAIIKARSDVAVCWAP